MEKKEIVDTKSIKNIVMVILAVAFILALLPVILYVVYFGGGFSTQMSDWSAFGDYIGGVLGTLFSLLAVIFSIVGIYISLKVASRVHENELKFNSDSLEREHELVKRQNKPFPNIDYDIHNNRIEIVLSNHGPGTMLVRNIDLIYDGISYKNFRELFDKNGLSGSKYGCELKNSFTVVTGGERKMLSCEDMSIRSKFDEIIKNTVIKLVFADIFDEEFLVEEDFSSH